jgi:hypothetical protein
MLDHHFPGFDEADVQRIFDIALEDCHTSLTDVLSGQRFFYILFANSCSLHLIKRVASG